jgi:hypothetical protein
MVSHSRLSFKSKITGRSTDVLPIGVNIYIGSKDKMEGLNFFQWVRYSNKKELLKSGWSCPGVYAIAYSNKNIDGKDFDYIKEIIYFGMSKSKRGLQGRLDQFYSTIEGKNHKHSGAGRIRDTLDKENDNWREKLYISLMPYIHCDVNSYLPRDLVYMGDIAKQEYVCFAKYVERYKEMPRFNVR